VRGGGREGRACKGDLKISARRGNAKWGRKKGNVGVKGGQMKKFSIKVECREDKKVKTHSFLPKGAWPD